VVTAVNPERVDLITNEPTDGDWRFEIWADVILEDFETAGEKKKEPPAKQPKGKPPTPKTNKSGP
jgi:hypothetical protein